MIFNYSDLDWQINEAGKRNATIILAIGYRLTALAGMHLPGWAANLSQADKQQDTLDYLKQPWKDIKTIRKLSLGKWKTNLS